MYNSTFFRGLQEGREDFDLRVMWGWEVTAQLETVTAGSPECLVGAKSRTRAMRPTGKRQCRTVNGALTGNGFYGKIVSR